MKLSTFNPEYILFADLDGNPDQLQNNIDEGPEGFEDRIPALINLMHNGEPYHRLLACVMLTSWGCPSGFEMLIHWAVNPEETPWSDESVTYDRITGADSAFESLADGVRSSHYFKSEEIRQLRKVAVKALLKLFPTTFFDNMLTLAIFSNDEELLPDLGKDIQAAIDASFEVINRRKPLGFNLQMQVASLLGCLRRVDESIAVVYAKKLIENFPDDRRMLYELVGVLLNGNSQETLELLEELSHHELPIIQEESMKALNYRNGQ
jgi:hypothetical protein